MTVSVPRPFRRAIDSVVGPGAVVLDVGAGSGILSLFAARAGAARVYAVEETTIAVLAQELAAANGFAQVVRVVQGDITEIEPPERVDVIVSEWLGGFGIDEGMLGPVIAARDRWLKPGGIMIPHSVTAWTALVHDQYLGETVDFLRANPYGLDLADLIEKTVNEISYSGSFRHLATDDLRSEPGRLWTTNADRISIEQARSPHAGEVELPVHRTRNGQRAGALVLRRACTGHLALRGPRRSTDALGDDDGTAALTHRPQARHGHPGQGQDRPRPVDRDVDKLGCRHARCRLGRAR